MLKKISIRKIILSSVALFAIMLLYLIPSNEKLKVKQELEYVGKEIEGTDIFLMDKNSYVALTSAPVVEKDIEKRAKELIKILTVGGMDSKVPSGFSAILPPDTEVLSITYDHEVLKINFSKDLLDIDKKLEEKMIEALVYTLTSIEKVDKIIIYVEGDILTKLPKTKINLPATLDRSFGINKEFNLTSTKDITDVTVYYINQINENYYYVPVTKYLNDDREKIKIVIEELGSSSIYNTNLMSFLNDNVKLLSVEQIEDTLNLNFNEYIYSNLDTKEILEEVIYTICLSIEDNYDVNQIVFNVNNEEIYKSLLKSIE